MTTAPPAEVLARVLDNAFAGDPPAQLGVAVSGGGDSMALLGLLAAWGRQNGTQIRAATINHGLRVEAEAEVDLVRKVCARLGVSHDVLHWTDWDGQGNLQAMARAARLELLTGWAKTHALTAVCMAHTRDDQAETVLLRLTRGSGVDGLSGMRTDRLVSPGLRILRPVLGLRRADLRAYLTEAGLPWVEDPSNDDPAFARVRARQVLAAPPMKGLDVPHLADTATRMAAARQVLERAAHEAAKRLLRLTPYGAITLERIGFDLLETETQWRLLAHALKTLSGNPYRPRLSALQRGVADIHAGQSTALHGCLILTKPAGIVIQREPAEAARSVGAPTVVWDNHWKISCSCVPAAEIRALGQEGWQQLDPRERSGVPHLAAQALPAIWDGGNLTAAPGLRCHPKCRFELLLSVEDIYATLLSH